MIRFQKYSCTTFLTSWQHKPHFEFGTLFYFKGVLFACMGISVFICEQIFHFFVMRTSSISVCSLVSRIYTYMNVGQGRGRMWTNRIWAPSLVNNAHKRGHKEVFWCIKQRTSTHGWAVCDNHINANFSRRRRPYVTGILPDWHKITSKGMLPLTPNEVAIFSSSCRVLVNN